MDLAKKPERTVMRIASSIIPITGPSTGRSVLTHAKLALSALLALALYAPSAQASEMGRLFFTPEQRTQLNYSYQGATATPGTSGGGVILSGIVQKHGGKRTAWINGISQEAGKSDDRSPESMPITLPGQSKPVRVKVGQRVLEPAASGK
jgi:hypothetical protein